ncbi:DUF5807 family protein [Haloferacaceae archaeon DSL9]
MSNLAEFLAGERLDDVAIYISEEYLDENLMVANYGEEVETGTVLVVPGDEGRAAFSQGTGLDPMRFAGAAMGREGQIHERLDGGVCPDDDETEPEDEHRVEFIFAFAEAENQEVGGLYADGDVIHAYAHCSCGTNFSQKWIAGER